MPLDALFADRLHFFTKLPFADALAEYEAPVSTYNSPPIDTEEVLIAGPSGDIKARIYRPAGISASDSTLPGLVWFHGGGFTQGNYDMNESDVVSREIAHRLKAVVMSVDYRLVTESVKFPVPQLDGVASTRWFASNAARLGLNPKKIFVGGISAGGCLAASVAVVDRDSGDYFLAGQLLNCPIAHFVAPPFSEELHSKLDEDPKALVISREYLDDNNRFLVGGLSLEDIEPHCFPGEVSDLSGLAPAQIINCEYDTLRASGEKFADQLAAAGNEIEVLTQHGVPHAHINRYPEDCKQMGETLDNMVRFMRETQKA
jgi:acetyl esterase/lipase